MFPIWTWIVNPNGHTRFIQPFMRAHTHTHIHTPKKRKLKNKKKHERTTLCLKLMLLDQFTEVFPNYPSICDVCTGEGFPDQILILAGIVIISFMCLKCSHYKTKQLLKYIYLGPEVIIFQTNTNMNYIYFILTLS